MELALTKDEVIIKNETYSQTNGIAMGNPLSPICAIVYMFDMEKLILEKYAAELKWFRYIDDIFYIIKSDTLSPQRLLTEINNINECIKFTLELPVDGCLPFLDFLIIRKDGFFQYHIYSKPTNSGTIIPFNSFICNTIKRGVVMGEIRRAIERSSSNDLILKSLELILLRFMHNGYTCTFLDRCLQDCIHRHYNNGNDNCNSNNHQTTKSNFIHIKTPYMGEYFHKKMITMLNQLNLRDKIRIYYTTNSLQKIFAPPKYSIQCEHDCKFCKISDTQNICYMKNLIYVIKCTSCEQWYIGQTCRILRRRIHEHFTNKDSVVYTHHMNIHPNTNIHDIFTFDVLQANLNFLNNRLYVESMYINKYRSSLMNGCFSSIQNSFSI